MRALCIALALALASCLFACGAAPAPSVPARAQPAVAVRAQTWPDADRLFRSDPHWLGGDAAVSIALDGERVLWLFGDSFVGDGRAPTRTSARFIRNSVALQQGRDPSRARIAFYARPAADGSAGSFFVEQDGDWFWPGHGVYEGGELTLFLERMHADPAPGGLGFRSAGYRVVRVHDVRGEPSSWQFETLTAPDTTAFGLGLVGVAVLLEADGVYAYAVREPGDHALMLLRWSRADFARGELMHAEFFCGAGCGFGRGAPAVVMADGASELSVTRAPDGGYIEVQSRGFGAAPIAMRRAPAPSGPWTALADVYSPEESARSGVLLYAARAHPEQSDAASDLVLTYNSNALDPARLAGDMTLYFPRYVRLTLR